jgi:glutathione S-transferase
MFFPLNSIDKGGRKGQFEIGDATKRWLESVRARPAYQRAVARMEEEEAGQKAKL